MLHRQLKTFSGATALPRVGRAVSADAASIERIMVAGCSLLAAADASESNEVGGPGQVCQVLPAELDVDPLLRTFDGPLNGHLFSGVGFKVQEALLSCALAAKGQHGHTGLEATVRCSRHRGDVVAAVEALGAHDKRLSAGLWLQ